MENLKSKVLLDIALCKLCPTILGWEIADDKYIKNNIIIEWSDFEDIILKNEIPYKDDFIDSILFFGDGTCEFHLVKETDSLNWGDFDVNTIKKVIKELEKICFH